VPPRTRTTSTAPAGRRPKVAGLRAPGRPGVTAESTRPSAPRDGEDLEELDGLTPETADTAVTEPADEVTSEGPDAARPASEDASTTTTAPRDATAARPAPSSKRGAQRTAGAAGTASSGGGARSGTALLERPAAPQRGTAPAEAKPRGGRLAGALSGVAAPFKRLGAKPGTLQAVLGAVVVVCLVLAGLAFWQGREAWSQGPVANQAVVDVGGTAQVVGQTRQGLEQILSYDFTKLDDSVNAAKSQSTGAFQSQYLSVFEQTIRGPATQQKLRQTASVLNIGVKQLSGDHATLMALVQFTAERTTNQQTTNAPGLLNVDVVRQDGQWKISALNPM
jgi:Mce-associated membrane protein